MSNETLPNLPHDDADWQELTYASPEQPAAPAAVLDPAPIEEETTKILGMSPRLLMILGAGLIGFFVLAIIIALLFLPPFQLASKIGLGGGGFETLSVDAQSLSHPDGITVIHAGGDSVGIKLDSIPREAFLAGDAGRDYETARTSIPAYLEMKSPLYMLETRDEGGFLASIAIPNDSEPYITLDLYQWDEETGEWVFVPSVVDGANLVITTNANPQNVAVFQTQAVTPLVATILEAGQALDDTSSAMVNLVLPTGVMVEDNGLLNGTPIGGWQVNAGYGVTPLLRTDNGGALSPMLNAESNRSLHVTDIQSFVLTNGYNGVAIDYRNINPADRITFALFIQELAETLDEYNKLVVVVLQSPAGTAGAWDTGGYDWRMIGKYADFVVVEAGNHPNQYKIDGSAFSVINYGVSEINRLKLQMLVPSSSFNESSSIELSYMDVLAQFGDIAAKTGPPEGASSYEPGTEIIFALSGSVTDLAPDPNSGAYIITADSTNYWIITASTVRARLDMASNYHLGGLVIADMLDSGSDPALLTAINEFKAHVASTVPSDLNTRWTVSGASGAVLTEETGIGTPLAWLANDTGEYEVSAAIVGGGSLPRGAIDVQVGEAATTTPAPTQAATQAPQTTAVPTATQPPVATQAPVAAGGSDGGGFELGGQIPLGTIPPGDLMRGAGMSWVKYQVKWNPGDTPAGAGDFVNVAHASGFKVLLSIPGPLYPSSIDFAAYTEFLRGVAAYQPDAIEIWNEMNLSREWPKGQIDPASYVNNMLAPGFNAIKGASPSTIVIIGALAPTGYSAPGEVMPDDQYVAGLAAAGAANYANCIGAHHNSGITPPSARSGHADGHYSWYFLPTIEVYYNGMGGALPVCITEFGYVTGEGLGPLPPTFSWGESNTVPNQADWLAEGASISRGLGWVRLAIVWNIGFTTWGDDPQAGYSITRPDGSCPACSTLGAAMQ